MSRIQTDKLELIQVLYQNFIERSCLCGSSFDIHFPSTIIIMCDWTCQSRDVILLKLSFLTELLEAQHCKWVRDFAEGLFTEAVVLDSVSTLLESEDSLVAFCACKCLAAAVIKTEQDGKMDFLQDLIKKVNHLALGPMNSFSVGEINKVVYTLDTLKHVIVYTHQKDHGIAENHNRRYVCACIGDNIQTNKIATDSHKFSLYYSIGMDHLPALMDRFLHISAQWCDHQLQDTKTQGITEQGETWNCRDFVKILMAFLELLHEILRHSLKSQMPEQIRKVALIFKKATNFLWFCKLPAILLKKILDGMNCIMDQYLELRKLTKSERTDDIWADIAPVANEVVTRIATRWLETIPYRDVKHGFGGTNIARCEGQSLGDFCKGDYPFLRQLVRLVMSSIIMVLKETDGNMDTTMSCSSCISALSSYIRPKMNQAKDFEISSWLMELFGDQDDGLILAMIRALELHKVLGNHAATITMPSLSDHEIPSQLAIASCTNTLNPHVIFVRFLETVTFDPNLLLDLLISNETCFLEYVVQYTHVVLLDWEGFCLAHHSICKTMEYRGNDHGVDVGQNSTSKGLGADGNEKIKMKKSICKLQGSIDMCINDKVQTVDKSLIYKDSTAQLISKNTGNQNLSTELIGLTNDQDLDCKRMKLSSPTNPDLIPSEVLPKPSSPTSDDSVSSKEINRSLDETMTVLIRLRLSIERMSDKNLFPYNVKPLLRLLESIEDQYEQ